MNTSAESNKKIDAMRDQLREMHKRSEIALRRAEARLQQQEKNYQKELADFTKKYVA